MSANTACDTSIRNVRGMEPDAAKFVIPSVKPLSRNVRILCGLFCLALSASVGAQTRFCIGGDVDHLNEAEIAACQVKMASVRDAVRNHGAPADWHFVVVCDEAGWKEYSSFTNQDPKLLSDTSYSTDPRLHWTFLRGSELNAEQPQSTATIISMALNGVPTHKGAPQLAPSERTRAYGVAAAKPSGSRSPSPAHHHG